MDLGRESGRRHFGLGYVVAGQHLDDMASLEDEDLVAEALQFKRVRGGYDNRAGGRGRSA